MFFGTAKMKAQSHIGGQLFQSMGPQDQTCSFVSDFEVCMQMPNLLQYVNAFTRLAGASVVANGRFVPGSDMSTQHATNVRETLVNTIAWNVLKDIYILC